MPSQDSAAPSKNTEKQAIGATSPTPAAPRLADLPPPLRDAIESVCKRARLWKHERADVEAELASHFHEGLAQGTAPDKLLADFGDVKAAARLIRRGKTRNRPLWWQVQRQARRAFAWAVLLCLMLYLYTAASFYLSVPTIRFNPQARHNVTSLAIPPSQRAWPVYRDALALIVNPVRPATASPDPLDKPPPIDPFLDRAGARCNQPGLQRIRAAASMRHLGAILGDPEDAAVSTHLARLAGQKNFDPKDYGVPDHNPPAYAILLPQLGVLRKFQHLVLQDLDDAIARGDAGSAGENLLTLFRLGLHCRQIGFLISDIVAVAILESAADRWREVVSESPDFLPDAVLRAGIDVLDSLVAIESLIRLDSERLLAEDIAQRWFTEQSGGDGVITPEGLRQFKEMYRLSSSPPPPSVEYPRLLEPVVAQRLPTRLEFVRWMETEMSAALALARVPAWNRPITRVEREGVPASESDRFLGVLRPNFQSQVWRSDQARFSLGATRVAIALEVFRRTNGALPPRLDDLVPAYVRDIPVDLADGRPLRYRRTESGYTLYSCGTDRKDNLGAPAPDNFANKAMGNFLWSVNETVVYDWLFVPVRRCDENGRLLPPSVPPKPTN